MEYVIGAMPCDGIGPEIVPVAIEVLTTALEKAKREIPSGAGGSLKFVDLAIGRPAIATHGSPVPEETLLTLESLDAWIMGPQEATSYPLEFRKALNPSGTLRKHFDLFANIRPAKSFAHFESHAIVKNTNLLIVRENTEGLYSDRNTYAGSGEFMPTPDLAITIGVFTRVRIERIAHVAFQYARQRAADGNRGRVSIVHKANVMLMTFGMFKDICYEVSEQYPDIQVDDFHIDALTSHLVRRADEFDVIVAENMFGDILSDLTGEIAGSLGNAPSINFSSRQCMAQAAHGSAPDIAGQNLANPIAIMLSGGMMLNWLGDKHQDEELKVASVLIESAISKTLERGIATRDMGGSAKTSEFAKEVLKALK